MKPSAKVVAATIAALLLTASTVLLDDGMPVGVSGWLAFASKVLSVTLGVGGVGYLKAETRPSKSALRAMNR